MNDIVYLVKESEKNEELRYSLRSVEANFPHRKVWFYGGCPNGLHPDHHIKVVQNNATKWLNTTSMLKMACANDEITDEFWLFNDDFFIMSKPTEKDLEPKFDGTLKDRIAEVEKRFGSESMYSRQLRRLLELLTKAAIPQKNNYALHIPMLIDRKKALKVFERYPNEPMFRCLYGNVMRIGGSQMSDVKWTAGLHPQNTDVFLSSDDNSFLRDIGYRIKEQFKEKSKYED